MRDGRVIRKDCLFLSHRDTDLMSRVSWSRTGCVFGGGKTLGTTFFILSVHRIFIDGKEGSTDGVFVCTRSWKKRDQGSCDLSTITGLLLEKDSCYSLTKWHGKSISLCSFNGRHQVGIVKCTFSFTDLYINVSRVLIRKTFTCLYMLMNYLTKPRIESL